MFTEAIKLANIRYNETKKELDKLEQECNTRIKAKKEELTCIKQSIDGLCKMQIDYDKEHGNLAVQKKICPFPDDCNLREFCTLDECNADTCSNGIAFRWS